MTTRRDVLRGALTLGASVALWGGSASHLFGPSDVERPGGGTLSPRTRALLERHLTLWEGGTRAELSLMRSTNPEWDFMGRTFLVLALVNAALGDDELRERAGPVVEAIVADTLSAERKHGMHWFLLPYARAKPWVRRPARSIFVDGEIAIMLAALTHLVPDTPLRVALRSRLRLMSAQMRSGPVLSGECYPNECWTFCNSFALAALQVGAAAGERVDPHLGEDWLQLAQRRLLSEESGLLVSSYTVDGRVLDGPEGSSLWVSTHNLRLVDESFARQQYNLANEALADSLLGFGYAREWPQGEAGPADIDSGPIVPLLEASPGSSGLAVLGAAAFGDWETYRSLLASLDLAAFPELRDGQLRYRASNQVGDSVLAYAATFGPLWESTKRRRT